MKVDLTKQDIDLLIQLISQVNVKLDQAEILMRLRSKLIGAKE